MATHQPSTGDSLPPKAVSVLTEHPDGDEKEQRSVVEPGTNHEYVTGIKLFIIVSTVAFAGFLMLLDNMIVSTVGRTFGYPEVVVS